MNEETFAHAINTIKEILMTSIKTQVIQKPQEPRIALTMFEMVNAIIRNW